jgi:alpha-tubulin suppressor-like RCC1 family protein
VIQGVSNVAGVSLGLDHSCAWTADGGAYCWGHNNVSQLGDGTNVDRAKPTPVTSLSGVIGIAAGNANDPTVSSTDDYAWTADGGLYGWGATLGSSPVAVEDGGGITELAIGPNHNCRVVPSGDVLCAGFNTSGQLGDTTTNNAVTPVLAQIPGDAGAVGVSVGSDFTCAWTSDKKVFCWGGNEAGQLGLGTSNTTPNPTPTRVPLDGGVVGVSAGTQHACAYTDDHRELCWGWAEWSSATPWAFPLPASVLGVAEVASVGIAAYMRATDGTLLVTTGDFHTYGPGNGTIDPIYPPVKISGVSGLVRLARGWSGAWVDNRPVASQQMCAWSATKLWCWGDDRFGQVGNGVATARWTPVSVSPP